MYCIPVEVYRQAHICRAVATGTVGMAMAVPLLTKQLIDLSAFYLFNCTYFVVCIIYVHRFSIMKHLYCNACLKSLANWPIILDDRAETDSEFTIWIS